MFNPEQANCDEDDDEREDIPLGFRGDACDPDPCVEISDRRPLVSDAILTESCAPAGRRYEICTAYRMAGDVIRFPLRCWGGVPNNEGEVPTFEEQTWEGNIQMAHCVCEPNEDRTECANPRYCQQRGEYGDEDEYPGYAGWWHDSHWDRPEVDPHSLWTVRPVGPDQPIEHVLFARAGSPTANFHFNETEVGWRWTFESTGGPPYTPGHMGSRGLTGSFASVWMRPVEVEREDGTITVRPPFGWDDPMKGNTYLPERGSDEGLIYCPGLLLHVSLFLRPTAGDHGPSPLPPGLDLPLAPPRVPPTLRPWEDLLRQPFQAPSLMSVDSEPGSGPGRTPFGLEETGRAALSALAVRHRWTGSGYESEHLPVRFAGEGQLDLTDFASTVMIEVPAENQRAPAPEDLNDLLSLWAFGGRDRQGRYYAELWRGAPDRGEAAPAYRFELVSASGGPAPRAGAMLLADVERQRLILLGGRSDQGLLSDLWVFDVRAGKWEPSGRQVPPELGLEGAAWQVSGESAYIHGGRSLSGQDGELWRLDLGTLTFEPLTDPQGFGPGPRRGAGLTLAAVGEVLYLFGGISDKQWRNDLWAYHLAEGRWELVAGECEPGDRCPPPARGSTLLSSITPGAVTLALGQPVAAWDDTERLWRYVRSARAWYPEAELRHRRWDTAQPGGPGGCLGGAAGSGGCSAASGQDGDTSRPWLPLVLLVLPSVVVLLRRRWRR